MENILRPLSLVTVKKDAFALLSDPNIFHSELEKRGGKWKAIFIFLGEIPNMPGHCVVIGKNSGGTYIGYHTSDFRELTDKEV